MKREVYARHYSQLRVGDVIRCLKTVWVKADRLDIAGSWLVVHGTIVKGKRKGSHTGKGYYLRIADLHDVEVAP